MFEFEADMTFVIPVKIDTQERERNLRINLEYIRRNMSVNVIISEMDYDNEKCSDICKEFNCTHLYKTIAQGARYNYSTALNIGARYAKTPLIAKVDVDTIVSPEQWERTIHFLKRNKAGLIYPYDGMFYNIHRCQIDDFRKHLDLGKIDWSEISCWSRQSVGGIQAYRLDEFWRCGGANEGFTGWGFEDWEINHRFTTMGCRVLRTQGPLWHLDHYRNDAVFYGNNEANEKMLKTMRTFGKDQYEQYIEVAHWMPKNHNVKNFVILAHEYR